jgi:metallo-beta-lactamase class B
MILPMVLWLSFGAQAFREGLAAGPVAPLAPFPIPLGSGISLLGALQPSAAYVVETSAGLVLIDSGLQSDAGPLKAQLTHLGLDWRQVRAILLTHAHWDHCGGAEHLRAATGARIHAGAGDASVVRAGGPREALYSAFAVPAEAEFHPTAVDVELHGGETLEFGDVRFRALAMPGHTPGSICYLMERAGVRALFAGDVISMLQGDEKSHLRIWKPLGTYSTYLPPRFRGDASAYAASLRALRALPVPDLILPGHPRADPTPQEPRLSAERWTAMLDQGIAEMSRLAARYQTDGMDFLNGEPTQLLPDLCYFGGFQGQAVYGLLSGSKLILVDAPGGPGLSRFVQSRLTTLGLKPGSPAAVLLTSCDPASIAGLNDLLEGSRAEVFVDAGGIELLARKCPRGTTILPAQRLAERGWLEGSPIPLHGSGLAQIAYRVRWSGKTVLFTGAFPLGNGSQGASNSPAGRGHSRDSVMEYLASVFRLSEPRPDLWLPMVPASGQNANLYDDQWQEILNDSYRAGSHVLPRRP